SRAGIKILMSGGTRCNITHATDDRGIVAAYGPPGRFLHSALAAFSVSDTLDFFAAEGVATKVEETGKVFPVSNRASDVLEALLPITVDAAWVPELRGVTVADAAVQILEGQRSLVDRRGSLLFAHFGLTGPVVLDVSRVVSGHAQPRTLTLELDFLPAMSEPA